MFGNKQKKQSNLSKLVSFMNQKGEVTQTEMTRELAVSQDAIEDYLVSLDKQGVKLCQKGRKISLWSHWNRNKDG